MNRFDAIEALYRTGLSHANEEATNKEEFDAIIGDTVDALLVLGVTEDELDEVLEHGDVI